MYEITPIGELKKCKIILVENNSCFSIVLS